MNEGQRFFFSVSTAVDHLALSDLNKIAVTALYPGFSDGVFAMSLTAISQEQGRTRDDNIKRM